MLKGLLHVHKRLCTLPLRTILSPALMYLDSGVVVTDLQGYFLSLLRPIFASTSYGKGVYTREGRYVRREDRLFNPLLREYFQLISDGNADMYSGKLARTLVEEVRSQKGVITLSDLEAYEVVERSPLRIRYGDREIIINPPPSSGGIKLALGLNLFEQVAAKGLGRDSVELLVIITEIMKKMNDFNPLQNERGRYGSSHDSPISAIIDSFRKELSETTFIANQGTTQISIIDEDGNAVSMTTSNGSGSGCFIPGTGVMLNNMMGEDDLHPDGFFSSQPGKRVSSMMAPTITLREGKVETALGSGGSKRIRNAIFQVLINMIEYGNSLEKAVESSRIHYEDDILHAEPGIASGIIEQLSRKYRVNIWDRKDVYFGGVHCVNSDMDGWGDSRRGGNFLRL
jgi:gamma-glutamyltranspeptidase/glutathione hydrolase